MSAWKDVREGARDVYDIFRRARSVGEVVKAVVPRLGKRVVLNEGSLPGDVKNVAELIRALRSARNSIKGHIDPNGKVDYPAVRSERALDELIRLAPGLQRVRPRDLRTDPERIAFFINLYNVLAIHGVMAFEIDESVMEVPSFFGRVSYRVGDVVLSLDEIENGILRRNANHPATRKPTLSRDSAAHAFAPTEVDPRIHMALVCASTSCPPVSFYDPDQLDAQLDAATRNFIASDVWVLPDAIEVPITFRYYADDWGGFDGVKRFLLEHSTGAQRNGLALAMERKFPMKFQRYNWGLNHL